MKKLFFVSMFTLIGFMSFGQTWFKGMYLQWGYNHEWYTRSNIHVILSNGDNFMLHNAKAHNNPGLSNLYRESLQISIPQYNYRVGFYLNKKKTRAIEINFDHIKYVVTDGQTVHVTGTIAGQHVDGDSVMNAQRFMHLEHTDGGNLFHFNYVEQRTVAMNRNKTRPLINFIWKVGAGFNVPRTDFTYHGDRFNNNFHVAGVNAGAEAGARIYTSKRFFFEGTLKAGYVRYLNALANTTHLLGDRVRHGFGYFEQIATVGYDFKF